MLQFIKRGLKSVYNKITLSQTKKEIKKACLNCDLLNDKKKLMVLEEILRNKKLALIDNDLSCVGICFSKDRALQLHALLLSYYKYVENPVKLYVLFTSSSEQHNKSYTELIKLFEGYDICFIKEKHFKNDLEKILENIKSTKCFFMTDDALFIDNIDLNDFIKYNPAAAIPSLTKGLDLTFCFAFGKNQSLPIFIKELELEKQQKCWNWSQAIESPDWAYPLSLDANLFDKSEILVILKNTYYKAPNTLESNMQYYLNFFIYRKGICYNKVKYVNIPCNIVQTEWVNNTTGVYDADFLLKQWEDGNRIYFEKYYQEDCKIVQKAKFEFVVR
jgi:hypothetical protein